MADGVRLSARIWMPGGPGPFPAVLETIPYRKRDLVRARDERNHPWLAARGFVCLRVDMRGSGDSEGHMPDMYSVQERADARQVIAWIAEQSWCSGRVGMFGTSWGGTASLQAAAGAPGPLRAVIANCATWDRFEDDIHWMGGCLLTDTLEWGATMPAILASPPDAATVGPHWREVWLDRLQRLSFPLTHWVQNRTRGNYWHHGSVRFETGRLSCPVLMIGGWSDRYANSVIPLVRARPDLCWGIVGPWGHHYPDQAAPGPAVSFRELALAWWRHWLTEDAPQPPDWPRLRLWRREFDDPNRSLLQRSGNWIALTATDEVPKRDFFLAEGRLGDDPVPEEQLREIPVNLAHGAAAGDTGYFGRANGLPGEQSGDDARALCFETEPLREPLSLVGSAELIVRVVRPSGDAQLVCRLCDVAPNGVSNLVCRGVRNLALDSRLGAAARARPGATREVSLPLPHAAYRFGAGHRVRLALATTYWPLLWPPAAVVPIRLRGARLVIPLEPPSAIRTIAPFPAPARTTPEPGPAPGLTRRATRSADGCLTSGWRQQAIPSRPGPAGLESASGTSVRFSIGEDSTENAECTVAHVIRIQRTDGTAHISSRLCAFRGESGMRVNGTLVASWQGTELVRRRWCVNAGRI